MQLQRRLFPLSPRDPRAPIGERELHSRALQLRRERGSSAGGTAKCASPEYSASDARMPTWPLSAHGSVASARQAGSRVRREEERDSGASPSL